MPLLDLPPELLALIAHHVRLPELRKSIAYLLVAKRWYHAILPVYLFRLPLSDLYLASHHDLEILTPTRHGTEQSNTNKDQTSVCPPCWSP